MSGNSYLDTCLTVVNGDSIILLYRKNAGDDWKEVSSYTKFKISAKLGFFTVDTLKFGEYVFANGHSNVLTSLKESQKSELIQMVLFPNPTSAILNVSIDNYKISSTTSIEICDMLGKVVKVITSVNAYNTISVADLSKGQYVLNLVDRNKKITKETFVID